jgi:hypothetical protein
VNADTFGRYGTWRTIRHALEDGSVIDETRSERTARVLAARLDALARAASRLRHAEAERLVELASVATMHAVALEMIQPERAAEIWREAHHRHPQLPELVVELPQRLAA